MNRNIDDVPKTLPELFRIIQELYFEIISKYPDKSKGAGSYWYNINQKFWDLQDFLKALDSEIEKLQFQDLTHMELCIFETNLKRLMDIVHTHIRNIPYELEDSYSRETTNRAYDTIDELREFAVKLEERFYQIIIAKASEKDESSEEGTPHC